MFFMCVVGFEAAWHVSYLILTGKKEAYGKDTRLCIRHNAGAISMEDFVPI